MRYHVPIGMAFASCIPLKEQPSDPAFLALFDLMGVESCAHSWNNRLWLRGSHLSKLSVNTALARAKSSGVVILKSMGSSSTVVYGWPYHFMIMAASDVIKVRVKVETYFSFAARKLARSQARRVCTARKVARSGVSTTVSSPTRLLVSATRTTGLTALAPVRNAS